MISEIEEEKLRETETKEERQLRRQTKRKIMMENGSKPRAQTMYAIKIGEEKILVPYQAKGKCASIERGKETKEEQRLRRRIQRDMIREEFYNGNNEATL